MSRLSSRAGKICATAPGARIALLALLMATASSGALAQTTDTNAAPPPSSPPPAPQAPSRNVVINLIRLLVQQGVLTQDKADALIREAEDEAAEAARAQGASTMPNPAAPPPTAVANGFSVAPRASTSIRVPYVPEFVKNQIKDEVKQEVLQEEEAKNYAVPNAVPAWTKRFHVSGDFRFRMEGNFFDKRNSPFFVNFSSLDAGAPFDLNNAAGTPPPLLDTLDDRRRARIRFRFGITADITDDISATLRLATGNTTNPVTTNQTLGTDLNKESVVIDRAYLDWRPEPWAHVWLGRFPNPWLYTDLVWSNEINFDGAAAQFEIPVDQGLSLTSTGGAFPIENTAFNFPDNTSNKQPSHDKWMFGGQLVADWQPDHDYDLKFGAAYYYFSDVQGKLSAPCVAVSSADPCSTDDTRPGSLQQGNTLFAIRNLVSTSVNPPVFQYYGLASPFRELNLTGRLDVVAFAGDHIVLTGDYVDNLAFNAASIAAKDPVNNRGASAAGGSPGPFQGGGMGYQAQLLFGYPDVNEFGQWSLWTTYRYLESDAVVDAFTDSDFHLGGTNAKGYIVGGSLGVFHNVNLVARWLSAHEITGSPYSVDVVQVDVNAKF